MNAPARMLTTRVGDATITVPEELAALAYVEQMLERGRPLTLHAGALDLRNVGDAPEIGEQWNGGTYAGLTLHDNTPMHLILLPSDTSGVTWSRAQEVCKEQGGCAPSRFDQLVLWTNLRGEFQKEAYWSSEQRADGPDYAWYQYFSYGNQLWRHKSNELRVRAVRRVPI